MDRTVFRDKYGRVINPQDLANEKRAALQKEQEFLDAKKSAAKGMVQRENEERYHKRLEDERHKPLAVYADDQELNDQQRKRQVFDDPMKEFLSKPGGKSISKRSRRRIYKGPPPPPNRFNIQPGYRWDGVDRGNGFEARFFKLENGRLAKSEQMYKWSSEDM